MNEPASLITIWAPMIGTAGFAWGIWTWFQNRQPRLSIQVEVRETADAPEIFYTVRNRGGQSTTIEDLQLVKYQFGPIFGRGWAEEVQFVGASFPESVKLPAVVAPGGVWTGSSPVNSERRRRISLDEDDRMDLVKKGKLFFKIRCSHFDRLFSGKVKMESLLPII